MKFKKIILERKVYILIISMIIIFLILFTYIFDIFDNSMNYTYSMEFTPNSDFEMYILEIPILIPHTNSDLIKNFERTFINNIEIIKGTVNDIKINNSMYGKTLYVKSNCPIKMKIEFNIKYGDSKGYIFSTRDHYSPFLDYQGYYWINYISENHSGNLKINYFWGTDYYSNEGILENDLNQIGWQKIIGKEIHSGV